MKHKGPDVHRDLCYVMKLYTYEAGEMINCHTDLRGEGALWLVRRSHFALGARRDSSDHSPYLHPPFPPSLSRRAAGAARCAVLLTSSSSVGL